MTIRDLKTAEVVPYQANGEWFRNSLERCPLGVAVISDQSFERLFVNQACIEMFGASDAKDFLKRNIRDSYVDLSVLEVTRAALRNGEDIVNMESQRYRLDGSIAWISTNSSQTVFDGQKAHIFWLMDVTERKMADQLKQAQVHQLLLRERQLEDQTTALSESTLRLSIAHDALKKLNTEKDSFISVLAHDLRAPFTGLLGATEMLAHTSHNLSPKDIAEYAASLHDTTANIYELLEKLIDWAYLHEGNARLQPFSYPVQDSIGAAIKELRSTMESKNIQFNYTCSSHRTIIADKEMIDKVCLNLLSNAIKFTASGGRVEVLIADDGGDVKISVSDTGVGISKSRHGEIFKLDKKHSTLGTEGEMGTGMGLVLSQEMVEKNGGRMAFESQAGKGSRFMVWLPSPK